MYHNHSWVDIKDAVVGSLKMYGVQSIQELVVKLKDRKIKVTPMELSLHLQDLVKQGFVKRSDVAGHYKV